VFTKTKVYNSKSFALVKMSAE